MIDKNIECDIVSDLLPLYLEGKTGDESNLFVREHLKQCEQCRKNLKYMEISDEDILKIAATGDKRNNKKKKHMNPFRKVKGAIFVCGYLFLLVLFWLYMIFILFP